MSKTLAAGVLCLCLCAAGLLIFLKRSQPEPVYTIPRYVQYSFTVQNQTNRLVKDAAFRIYGPVSQTSTQKAGTLETSHPYELTSDSPGNRILRFTFPELPPYATKIITVKADLRLSDTPNRLSIEDSGAYLVREQYCRWDNPELLELANTLKAKEPLETAENVFRWVSDNIRYTGYVKNTRGALDALRNKKGDCTEFMYLFVALCRANGIPARGMGGYVVPENAVLKPSGYHNWAEFYVDDCWHLADPQKKVFMENQSRYIAMRVISESSEKALGGFNRFRCEGEGLKAKMNG